MPTSRRQFIRTTGLAAAGMGLGTAFSCQTKTLVNTAWSPKASLPHQLQEIYCAVLNKRIHIAGGFLVKDGDISISTHHIAYDPKRDSWQAQAAIPAPRHHLQLVAQEGQLFGFAGFEMQSSQALWIMHQQTWAYDPLTNEWSQRTPAPQKHAETVAASLSGKIHIVGGRTPGGTANANYRDHQDTDQHLVYDPGADSWDTAAPALTARNSAAGAVIDGQLYVVGGRTVIDSRSVRSARR